VRSPVLGVQWQALSDLGEEGDVLEVWIWVRGIVAVGRSAGVVGAGSLRSH